jgi:ABC-2 type transport system permease protein
MRNTVAVLKRELAGYFATPVAYVFIVVFLLLAGFFTFQLSDWFRTRQADLRPFFFWLPILYLFVIPAIAMRLWSEERKGGTIELLLTLPIGMGQAVIGKFLAAWLFAGLALALTFPYWLACAYLGDPDHGVILAGYLGGFLVAGAYLAVGACISALTKNQVIAFVLSVALCMLLTVSGLPAVVGFFSGWAPGFVVDSVRYLSTWTHFEAISKGVLDLRDIVYFVSLIALALFANAIAIDHKKAD